MKSKMARFSQVFYLSFHLAKGKRRIHQRQTFLCEKTCSPRFLLDYLKGNLFLNIDIEK